MTTPPDAAPAAEPVIAGMPAPVTPVTPLIPVTPTTPSAVPLVATPPSIEAPTTPAKPLDASPIVVSPRHRHVFRTLLSALFGSLALSLVFISILAVWFNQTFTHTDTYVRTVTPLIAEPAIQNFLADKVTDSLLNSAPPAEIAAVVLSPVELARMPAGGEAAAVKESVSETVLQIVRAPKIQQLWMDTNRASHDEIVTQLKNGSDVIELDLSPLANGILAEMSSGKLASVSDKVVLPENVGKLNLSGSPVAQASKYYQLLQTATLVVIGVLFLALSLAVALSVEHIRTFRRILVGSGTQLLLLAALLQVPAVVRINLISPVEQAAGAALVGVLFHDLQLALIIIGASCIVLAIISKIWSKTHHKKLVDTPGQVVQVKQLMKEEEHEKSLAI